jgi:transposase
MTSITYQPPAGQVVVGVDTHKHFHVAVALNHLGVVLGQLTEVADADGYVQLARWASTHGQVVAFGVEGTGSYGAGLASHLRRCGHRVVDVNRPDRRVRRQRGKTDPINAENAARALLDRHRWRTRLELANAIFEYLEIFHNRRRRHSAQGWLTPLEKDKKQAEPDH